MSNMTPREIVSELDLHIVGQDEAKRTVAIALRNRWRRMQLDDHMREEISPKNILMIGPTGVGKTEIARRLARLAQAPFIKVEATKFTEVGYVGRDVESIVRDLMEVGMKLAREKAMKSVQHRAEDAAEDRLLDVLLRPARDAETTQDSTTRQTFRKKLREGSLDDREIEIELAQPKLSMDIMAPPGMEEMSQQLQSMFSNMAPQKKQSRRVSIRDARKQLIEEEASKLINEEELKADALTQVEQNGIVFIDEIDKIARQEQRGGGDVSREGVQRDLLPLIEGCTVNTKHGTVRTDHILFIGSGAFHFSKPSDLIPELQGRLPLRVELKALTQDDFAHILTGPDCSLTQQYQALLATEGLQLEFMPDGVARLAEIAFQVNERTENIGARRLHTLLEKLLEEVSFSASEQAQGESLKIDAAFVSQRLDALVEDVDLSRFIL